MADPPKPKGKGAGFLTRKVGPLPMWAVLVLTTVVGYWLYKKYTGASSAATATTTANPTATTPSTDTTGLTGGSGTSGDTTGLAAAGVDPTALINSLGAQNSTLQSSLLQSEANFEQFATSGYQPAGVSSAQAPSSTTISPQPGGSNAPVFSYSPVPVSSGNFAQSAVAQTQTATKAGKTSAFGGVTSVAHNAKTGITTTTYQSGRVVEQKAGKTAYVAKR